IEDLEQQLRENAQKVFPKFLCSRPDWGRIFVMDAVDRKILAELQRNGRLTITELADRVRLSISPCHRRLRALEKSGAIAGYHAQLDAHSLGLTFEALIFVTMHTANRDTLEAFEQAVVEIPHVLQA